jgi:hypothetical protein
MVDNNALDIPPDALRDADQHRAYIHNNNYHWGVADGQYLRHYIGKFSANHTDYLATKLAQYNMELEKYEADAADNGSAVLYVLYRAHQQKQLHNLLNKWTSNNG